MADFDLQENMKMVKEMRVYSSMLKITKKNKFDEALANRLAVYADTMERTTKHLGYWLSVLEGEKK